MVVAWGKTHRDGEENSKLRSRTQEGNQREGVIEEWMKTDGLGDGKSDLAVSLRGPSTSQREPSSLGHIGDGWGRGLTLIFFLFF